MKEMMGKGKKKMKKGKSKDMHDGLSVSQGGSASRDANMRTLLKNEAKDKEGKSSKVKGYDPHKNMDKQKETAKKKMNKMK